MQSLTSSSNDPERPVGIALIAGVLTLAGLSALVFAMLLFLRAVPLSYGSVLLQGGLEQSGPISFLVYGAVTLGLAWTLWTRQRWARRLTILFAAIGVALAVPAISSAVADARLPAIVCEGLQIMIRVAAIFYLMQPPVRDWFSPT